MKRLNSVKAARDIVNIPNGIFADDKKFFQTSWLPKQEYIAPSNIDLCGSPPNTFQSAMKLTLIIGQIFGLNPVLGARGKSPLQLRFTFRSSICMYAVVSVITQGTLAVFCLLKIIHDADSSLSGNTSIVFFTSNCFMTALFLRIASKWPALCRTIAKFEEIDPVEDNKLVRKCNMSVLLVLLFALVEHLLSDLAGIAMALNCQPGRPLLEAYVLQSFPWVWTFLPYNIVLAIVCKIICFQATVTWSYSNVFIICVSWYLIARLEQINQRILSFKGKMVHSSIWALMREDYSRASHLVKSVNEVVSGVVFVAFAQNLFSVCMQILHALEVETKTASTDHCTYNAGGPLKGYEGSAYFLFSSAFLIGRSLAVSLIAAKVHCSSREPAVALYHVPAGGYNVEIQRFLAQVHGDTIALTGYNFFYVTRGLVLIIGATIVTYELVFMQFAGVTTVVPTTVTLADLLTGQ